MADCEEDAVNPYFNGTNKNLHNKNLIRVYNYPNCEFNLEMYLNPDPSDANRRI